jgi:type IV pilus assembly protein PilY1
LSSFFEWEYLYSPFNNRLYYNPLTTYGPGYEKGERVKNATVGDADVVKIYQPKTKLKNNPSPTLSELRTEANYDSQEVTQSGFKSNDVELGAGTASNPFGKHNGGRTDCAGDPCTLVEERQNIANWRAFHRRRIFAAKTGLSAAFAGQPDNFRLAYADLYTPPPLTTMTDFGVVKSQFFDWLDSRTWGRETPLRSALDRAGKYYQDAGDNGPWGARPWVTPTDTSPHLACRRSYTLLITDGYWNNPSPTPGNPNPGSDLPPGIDDADGKSDFPELVHKTTGEKYQYKPGNTIDPPTDPRNAGKSDKTDGAPGIRGETINDASTSGTLADVALKYWATDLQPGLENKTGPGGVNNPPFWQNMTTYTVSFGAYGAMSDEEVANAKAGKQDWPAPTPNQLSTIDDLRHAAHNGGGDFLTVTDAEQFKQGISKIISQIAGQNLSESGIAASGTVLNTGTRKFVPLYNNGTWWGNLQKVKLGVLDGEKDVVEWQVIETANGQPTGKTTLPLPANRKIFVWVDAGKQAIEFTYANIDLAGNMLKGSSSKLQLSSAVNADLVNFLRGDQTREGQGFRRRPAVLGDIVNSTPVFIKNNTNPKYEKLPGGTPGLGLYASYMKAKRDRSEGVLFVGANDGMLHAFAEGSDTTAGGRELFAYVPRSVLGKMESLASVTYAHTYLVDGPLNEVDTYVATGTTPGWKNLVLGTTGAGAKAVFALDVTKPLTVDGKSVLWEINPDRAFPVLPGNAANSFQELGHVLSAVQSGITQSGHWVSIFGNGYDSKSGQASLFIVETGSGKLLKEIKTDNTSGNGLGGVRLVLNGGQQIIGAYAGDLQGRVWKFDLSGATPDEWKLGNDGSALFTARNEGKALPITAQPHVMERRDQFEYLQSYLVTVVTGKLFEAGDPANTTPVQAAYGLWDKKPFGPLAGEKYKNIKNIEDSDLEQTKASEVKEDIDPSAGSTLNAGPVSFSTVAYADPSVTRIDWSRRRGWKLSLNVFSGQRGIYPIQMYGEVVKIDTIVPAPAALSCQASSSKALSLLINPLTGTCRRGGTFDTNADGNIDANDANVCAYTSLADGADVVLLRPAFSSGGSGTGSDTGSGSNQTSVSGGNPDKVQIVTTTGILPADVGSRPIVTRSWRQIFPRAN